MKQRVVVGISGASGAAIGLRILERLAVLDTVETHLVVSGAAEKTLRHEVGDHALARARELADVRHDNDAVGSTIASGSFRTLGMIVAPCSMLTLSAITFVPSASVERTTTRHSQHETHKAHETDEA